MLFTTALLKTEIIIFGLKETEQTCAEVVKIFFTKELEIKEPPEFLYAYWKGKNKGHRPAVVKFSSQKDKGRIYTNATKLKGKKNEAGRSYKITDHLPEELAEQQQRNKQIITQNFKLLDGDRQEMKIKGGKLMVGNLEYKKKIQNPTAKTLLNMESDHIQTIQEFNLAQSKEIAEKGSRFKAYALPTSQLSQVQNVLQHIRRKYSSASHVCMCYRFAGIDKAYGEDYLDDGDHAIGRRMLEHLIQNDKTNIAVFLIRYYGGQHLGNRRFEIMRSLMDEVVDCTERGVLIKSILPLRCLIEPTSKKGKKTRKATSAIRGGHANHPRFNSTAYNRFTLLAAKNYDSTSEYEQGSLGGFNFSDPAPPTFNEGWHNEVDTTTRLKPNWADISASIDSNGVD